MGPIRLFVYTDALSGRPRNQEFLAQGAEYLEYGHVAGLSFYMMNGVTPIAMIVPGGKLFGALFAVEPRALAFMDGLMGYASAGGTKRLVKKVYTTNGQKEDIYPAWVHFYRLNVCAQDKPFKDIFEAERRR